MEANWWLEVIVETPYDTIIKNICKFDVIYLDIFAVNKMNKKDLINRLWFKLEAFTWVEC
mgnify:CR=1 FL=1